MKRRKFTSEFKPKVVLEVLNEQEPRKQLLKNISLLLVRLAVGNKIFCQVQKVYWIKVNRLCQGRENGIKIIKAH